MWECPRWPFEHAETYSLVMPVQKDDHTFLQSPLHYAPPSPGSLHLRSPCVFVHYPINSPNPFVLERGIWDFFSPAPRLPTLGINYLFAANLGISVFCLAKSLSKRTFFAWAAPFLHNGSFLMLQTLRQIITRRCLTWIPAHLLCCLT